MLLPLLAVPLCRCPPCHSLAAVQSERARLRDEALAYREAVHERDVRIGEHIRAEAALADRVAALTAESLGLRDQMRHRECRRKQTAHAFALCPHRLLCSLHACHFRSAAQSATPWLKRGAACA